MIRRKEELAPVTNTAFGGPGEIIINKILTSPEEMYSKGRLFNFVTLEPGVGIGYHVHNGDGETYYILSGEGEYSDNGSIVTLRAGDTAFCDAGEGHSLLNTGDQPLTMIALILYK